MSKFRKIKLASAMLCTLLFGGNASAMQKDVSKGISKIDKLKDNLSKGQTKDKELENRKPDDSSNPLLKYVWYVLGGVKLADEGVGVAEAKEYIKNKKFSPLGKLSIYKDLVARSYRAKTVETMRKLVGESNKNKYKIHKFFDKVNKKVYDIRNNEYGCFKVKENLFDISLAATEKKYLNINDICRDAGLTKDLAIPGYVEEYVKAVLGVPVEECNKILVNVNQNNKYIAFVKGNVCLKLADSKSEHKSHFTLCGISDEFVFDSGDYELDLDYSNYCFKITLPYMERILGVKHDENYIDISTNGNKVKSYSFYGQIFHDLFDDWKGGKFEGSVGKIFPDVFPKKEEEIQLIKEEEEK